MLNELAFLIFSSDVHCCCAETKLDFSFPALVSYPATLWNTFISSNRFLVNSLGFHLWMEIFTSLFTGQMSSIQFSYIIALATISSMLNSISVSTLVLSLMSVERFSVFHHWDVSCGFFMNTLYHAETFSICSYFPVSFYCERVLDFVICSFLYQLRLSYVVLHSIKVKYYTGWIFFCMLKHPYILVINSTYWSE